MRSTRCQGGGWAPPGHMTAAMETENDEQFLGIRKQLIAIHTRPLVGVWMRFKSFPKSLGSRHSSNSLWTSGSVT